MKKEIGPVGLLFVGALLLAGCAMTPSTAPTSLQIQAYQTKEFEVDKAIAFGAVISVFQDLGYIVQSADKDTGFITASSPTKSSNFTFSIGGAGGATSDSQTKATAFLEQIRPNFTSIRLNFVVSKHTSSVYGQQQQQDRAVVDPPTYQSAFEKIADAVFIRSGTRGSTAKP